MTDHEPVDGASTDEPVGDAPDVDLAAEVVAEVDAQDAEPNPAEGSSEMLPGTDTAEVVDIEQLRRQRDEYLDTLRRVQADFENSRKRAARERAELQQRASEGLVEQLLPVLDSFELALLNSLGLNAEATDGESKLRKGVELVYAELLSVLERAGLERIQAEGKPFDPEEHEAVMSVEGAANGDPSVVEVMRSGWRLRGRVLRPAMVKVSR